MAVCTEGSETARTRGSRRATRDARRGARGGVEGARRANAPAAARARAPSRHPTTIPGTGHATEDIADLRDAATPGRGARARAPPRR